MMKIRPIITILLFLMSCNIFSITVKIGSVAPAKSPWDDALRELGREWKSISGGEIKLKIYPGGIAGNEEDMIRKMKVGILGGAVFTNVGLTKIFPDFYVLSLPFLFDSEEEFNYTSKRMNPSLEEGIKRKGYKVVIWSMAGWIRFFSEHKVEYPDDLKKHKLSFTTGEPEMEQVWKKSGYQVIPNDINDLMMGLQSGMVNAFYLPPLIAASGQYFPLAPYMLDMKITPIYGGIVISDNIWEKVPDKYKEKMMAKAKEISDKLERQIKTLESDAIETMKKNGLKVISLPGDSMEKWRESSDDGTRSLIDRVFSREYYDRMINYLNEFRKTKNVK